MNYPYLYQENNYPKAFGIAGSIMGFLVLVSFFIMIGNRLPQFGMGGMVVNYGTAEFGMGDDYMTVDEPSMHPNANEVNPDMIDPNLSPDLSPSQQISDRSVVTQDMEDAPAVAANETKKANATETTVDKKDSQPTVNPNALYKGRQNTSTGRGDGTSNVAGNQGSNLGDPLASNYGEGGSGYGNTPLSITNMSWVIGPKFQDDGQYEGVIAVEVFFGNDGSVIRTNVIPKGTTISLQSAWNDAERAFRGARLNAASRSSTGQRAVFHVVFKLR